MIRRILLSLVTVMVLFIFSFQNSFCQGKVKNISLVDLKDKIAGAWIGQMIGNIYGLPHENKYINSPGPENWPYGYTKNIDKLKKYNGAFSDDDTDVEYMYLLQMLRFGPEPSYEQLKAAWMYHIRDRVWLANRGALGLMHFGYTPPFTGSRDLNPHWYQIDPQLINEIWAYTAPGMVKYAAQKSDFAGHITSDDWGVEPTIVYGAMYSAAFFEKDIMKLIQIGLESIPENGRYAQTIRKMISLYKKYPEKWQMARQEMADEFYTHEPEMTKTIWNANLNGACGILAMLYGNGDFQKTLDLSCAMGFDADNQAATIAGLLGVMYGFKALPENLYLPVEGWTKPFNDRYINITRFDLPDASIEEIIENTVKTSLELIESKGGKISGQIGKEIVSINPNAEYTPPLEFYIGPLPRLEVKVPVDYTFYSEGNKKFTWRLKSGKLPEGTSFNAGRLTGIPEISGYYSVVIELSNGSENVSKEFRLVVRNTNIASTADTLYTNVRTLNEAVLDSCWYTFGKPMYAKNVEVICDGKINGEGSVFYSLDAKSRIPKVDYYGYGWKSEQDIDMIAFHTGCLEEFGGWFTSLNVQYQDANGKWIPVEHISFNPELPKTDIVFFQPHFAEYLISFDEVKTKAIRIIGDAKVEGHWNKYTKNVSAFTSITELSVYEAKKSKK
jgi:ADP-ribosylglycohydrolase